MTDTGTMNGWDQDPTLLAVDKALIEKAAQEPRRSYLGASLLGHPCERHVYYAIQPDMSREPMKAAGIKAIQDGHRTEELLIERLRMVPGVTVWNLKDNGEQWGFQHFDGKLRGHIDGVIVGILQAPKTPHLLEIKCCNLKKFEDLKKKVATFGEKGALREWDFQYYVQAQLYLHFFDLTRHYLVCASPGGRDATSCRTEYNRAFTEAQIEKARRIINAVEPPSRVSDNPSYYICKWCDFFDVCHPAPTASTAAPHQNEW
jgi:hypothetical protein